MKKLFPKMMLLIVTALAIIMMPVSTQAATKSAVTKKADAVTKDITRYANYRGWEVKTKVTKQSSKQVKKSVRIETASGTYFKYTQVTKKSGKKYKTYFLSKGKKFKTSEVKSGVKRYSNSKTIKSFLKARVQKSAKSLANYAKARNWNTSTKVTATSSKKAVVSVTFSNKQYKFVATATVKRSKTPKTTYTRKGSKSSAKAIKAWLEQYKDKSSGSNDTPDSNSGNGSDDSSSNDSDEPGANTDAVTDADVVKLVADKVISITEAGKAKGWTITESGTGTLTVKLHFENSEYQFDVTVNGVNQAGKAVISYTLMGMESDEEEILSWLTKYKASGTTPATETPAPIATPEPLTPISNKDLAAAARADMDELTTTATLNSWSSHETANSGTKIQSSFENSEWEFKVAVEAKAEDGKIVTIYTLTGESETETDKETILEWFVKYKADPLPTASPSPEPTGTPEPTTTPEPTGTPEPGTSETPAPTDAPTPTATPDTPITQEDLVKAAKTAMTELEIEGTLNSWAFERIVENEAKVWNYFYNSMYGFYASTEAKVEDGKIVIVYTVKAKGEDDQAIVPGETTEEWLTRYKTAAATKAPEAAIVSADKVETNVTTAEPLMPCRLALINPNGQVTNPDEVDTQPGKPSKAA